MKRLITVIVIGLLCLTSNAQTALDFNGNNYVQTQTIPALTDFTIEFDIRYDGPGTGAAYQRILSTFNNGFSIALDGTGPGTVQVYSNDWPAPWTMVGYSLPLGTWVHMAWVKQGVNLSLYVDGAFVSTTAVGAGGTVSSAWYLSANQANFTENANSTMDNFRIWDDVRTPAEIAANYNICLTGSEANLIVLYDMEEGVGTTTNDLATGDGVQDGTLTGGPIWTGGVACSPPPGAASFDGTDDIISTTTNVGIEDICDAGFTMEAFVYANSTAGVRSIIRKTGDYNLYLSGGTLIAEVWADGTTNMTTITGPAGFFTGFWTHVAFTWDGTNGNFYINGVLTAGVNSGPTTVAGVANFNVGESSTFTGQVWDGDIDEVRLWTCVKSQADIIADRYADHVGNESGLALFYDFSDGTGTTLTDLSVNGNNGTLTNGPIWVPGVDMVDGAPTFTGCAAPVATSNNYWVGGTGNWSDAANHWANASGGVPGSAGVPTFGNNAIFDDNSGLTAVDVVNIDIVAEADTLTFDAVSNAFVFNNSGNNITIDYSLIGNISGVTFTGTWGEIIFNATTAGEIITSGGTTWQQDFRISGSEAMTMTDNLNISTGTMFVDNGGLILSGFDLTCTQFDATVANTRTLDLSGANVNVTGGTWGVDPTTLTLTSAGSTIFLGDNAGNASFTGGGLAYDTLHSLTATTLSHFDDNSFKLFAIPASSTLEIDNGTVLSTDSLIASGNCGAPTIIKEAAAGANASINKTGFPELHLYNVQIDGVNATAPATYNIYVSQVLAGTGWTPAGVNFYWVGDSGIWHDGNHWAFSSGGPGSGCVPQATDSVFFDLASFSASGQQVIIQDSTAYCGYMDWTAVASNQVMQVDTNLNVYGDMILNPGLFVTRTTQSGSINFMDQADLNSNSGLINCNIFSQMAATDDTLSLSSTLNMTDSVGIIIFNGVFLTQDNDIFSGSLQTIDNTGGADSREIQFGSSYIYLKQFFYTVGVGGIIGDDFDDTGLTFDAGTSNLYIGDTIQTTPVYTSYFNGLRSAAGLQYYDVTLNFQRATQSQYLEGSNTMNSLTVVAGSKIDIVAGSDQTIVDTLIMLGTCQDSIWINSDGSTINFNVTAGKDSITCLLVKDVAPSNSITAYYSTDGGNNGANWTFDTSAPATASFTADGPFCFGDTTLFTNTSTSVTGSMSYVWNYNDGSYFNFDADSITAHQTKTINYPQTIGLSSSYDSLMTSWTEISDAQSLFDPVLGEAHISNNAEAMRYDFTIGYDLSLINPSAIDTAYLVDMDDTILGVSYHYRPIIKIFKNGSPLTSTVSQFSTYNFYEDSLVPPSDLSLGTDTLSFSLYALGLLPTDMLTIYTGVVVTSTNYGTAPRWKNDALTTATDMPVTFEMNIDTIHFKATPVISSFSVDTLEHQFISAGAQNVSLIVMDNVNLCTDTVSVPFTIHNPQITLTTNDINHEICAGDEVTFEANSSTAGVSFEFFINGVSQTASPSPNDTLLITTSLVDQDTISVISSIAGCTSLTEPQYIFTVDPLPVYTATDSDADNIICAGDTVTFNASSTDVTDSYQYLLNYTAVTVFEDTAGYYSTSTLANNDTVSVIALTTNGCRDTTNTIFTVNPLPTTSLATSVAGSIICDGTPVTFTASGAVTYEFFINGVSQGVPGGATFSIDTLTSADVVSVVGYSASGCSKLAPETYNYSVLPLPIVTFGSSDADQSICSGEAVTFTGGGGSLYNYLVNGISATGGATPASNYVTDTLSNGDVIELIVQSSNGCVDTSNTLTFTVIASPITVLTSTDINDTICQGESVTFSGSGATNYEFFVNGTSQGASSPITDFTTTSLTDGQTISVTGESNGCYVSDQVVFTVLPNPSVSLFSDDIDNTICDGDPITLTGTNAVQYELFVNGISQGPAQASPTFTNPTLNLGSNSLYVIGTAPNGCTNQSTAVGITVNPIPTVVNTSSDADNIICTGESVTFTGTGSTMYQFLVDGVAQTVMSATNTYSTANLTDGAMVTIVGTSLGCVDTSNAIITTVNPTPVVSLTNTDPNNVWCENEVIDFTATGATNYEFFVNGVSQGAASPTNTLNSVGFPLGTSSVQVIGESTNCTNTASNTITINPLPVPTITSSDIDNTICAGDNVTYTGAGGSLYEFFIDGVSQGAPSVFNSLSSSSLANGNVVSVNVTSSTGCQASDALAAITVNPVPSITLTSSDVDFQICEADNVTFTGNGGSDYEFFINGVSQGPASPTNTFSTSTLQNTDVVEVVGTSLGCSNTSTPITFTVFGFPNVSLINNGDSQICVGENTDLTATGAANYQFSVNGVPTGAFSATDTYTGTLNDGDIVTVAGETNGCSSTSADSFTFTVYNYPTLTSSSSDVDNIICLNDLVTITASGAMEYEFLINGTQIQYGALSTFDVSTLQDGDVLSAIGYNGDCPSTADTYTFTVNSMNLDLTASPSSMICTGENVTFTATGGDEYEFFLNGVSTGAMSATNTYSSTTLNDMDEVTVTAYSNSTMCTQVYSDYILMNVIDEPVITPQSAIDFCEGDSVVLVSNMAYGNQWYVDGTAISGATDTAYVAYTTGQYTLEATSGGTGTVWSFGHNPTGSFGNGDNLDNPDPTQATTTQTFDELSSGYNFVLGVNTAGEVYAWGENSSGQLGQGTYTSSNVPVIVPTLTGIKTVSTTESSSMAVTSAGDVYVWGNNSVGQLGTGNTSVINFPFLNTAIANTDTIAGGRNHFVILKNDGTVWTVGNNSYGQLGQGNLVSSMSPVQVTALSNVVAVGAGEYHSFAIDNTGDLYVWGNNGSGQLGLNDLNNRLSPTVSPLRNVISAQGGANHSAYLTSDKKVYTSGGNAFGQLGTGNLTPSTTATEINISGAEMISTGQYTTLVLRSDRSVFGFGNNTEDQLSSLSGNTVSTPEHIVDLDGVGFIEASQLSSHVIYNESHACVSAPVDVNMITVPLVTISANGDTLSTVAGVSYQWYFNGLSIPGANSQTYVANESGDYTVEVGFASGCSGTSAPYYHSLSGIEDVVSGEISLYPNPAYDKLNLELFNTGDATSLVMVDQTGRLVLEMNNLPDGKHIFNVSELSDGVYMIHLKYEDGASSTLRFVKSTL